MPDVWFIIDVINRGGDHALFSRGPRTRLDRVPSPPSYSPPPSSPPSPSPISTSSTAIIQVIQGLETLVNLEKLFLQYLLHTYSNFISLKSNLDQSW